MQRRRQKVWEEAPAVCLPDSVREELCNQAVALAQQVNYKGAGTVEFLYDQKTQDFYFIEVNTRIQVEHTITEAITGVDLVQEMIRIAGGEKLSFRQEDLSVTGHAIECRINAEDPSKDFMPWPGVVDELTVPDRDGVRFDTLLYPGYAIPPYYDSLLGKLIVWGTDRNDCLSRLRVALQEIKISGVPTTIPLHIALADDVDVSNGDFDTKFLEKWLVTKFAVADKNIEQIGEVA
jgi:acetyl-CoA carboxylase biotin carboxylase subunit